jgi:hypothetical protein
MFIVHDYFIMVEEPSQYPDDFILRISYFADQFLGICLS